ncbi:pyocin activator PrtN family protein [Acinetobacter sp. B5B]|uniref:pyocin activator PrtN family protein n=2 Tax=Acinetobacter TaxID=469 RepID=UPI0018A268ED|nr:pyocin activator PrtN family protein [Acinetobacter rathckeae]MBF7683015.1 pyocin activator PrtN family protein [Acinetobacter baretiae]MBF7696162.1 pyocin activator PrtN family protein [Acinetobacter rathckeae]
MKITTNKCDKIDTSMMLILRYKRPVISLRNIIEDYMPHLDMASAKQRASKCKLPFPAFKVDGNKSEYFVNVSDIAAWLDSLQQESKINWSEVN